VIAAHRAGARGVAGEKAYTMQAMLFPIADSLVVLWLEWWSGRRRRRRFSGPQRYGVIGHKAGPRIGWAVAAKAASRS